MALYDEGVWALTISRYRASPVGVLPFADGMQTLGSSQRRWDEGTRMAAAAAAIREAHVRHTRRRQVT